MSQSTECLKTTLRNASGGTKIFSFLPPHGRELEDGEEFTVLGGPTEAIRKANRFNSTRQLAALEAALEGGDLEIISTPNPVFYDPTLDETKMLKVDDGVLYAADPCWLATSDSSSIN